MYVRSQWVVQVVHLGTFFMKMNVLLIIAADNPLKPSAIDLSSLGSLIMTCRLIEQMLHLFSDLFLLQFVLLLQCISPRAKSKILLSKEKSIYLFLACL